MERARVHVLAPGEEGQVATTRSGEVVWDDVPVPPPPMTAEDVRDIIAAALVAGTGITVTPDDAGDSITIAYSGSGTGGLDLEQVQDAVAAMLVSGTGVGLAYDDALGTLTVTNTAPESGGGGGLGLEEVQDAVAAMLTAGTNVTLTYDDVAGTLTVDAAGGTGTGLDAEQVRDVVAAMLAQGSGITLTHDDAGDTLTIAATGTGGGGASALDGLTDVDTTTDPPATGEALVWDAVVGQWVPGLPVYPSPADLTPEVVAVETFRFAAPPYTADVTTLGAGNFDASDFDGELVVVMSYRNIGTTGASAPAAHWTIITGQAFENGLGVYGYRGAPTATVTMPLAGTANAPAQMTVLAITNAEPLSTAGPNDVDSFVSVGGANIYPQFPHFGIPVEAGDVVVAVLNNDNDAVNYLDASPQRFYDMPGDLLYTATGTAPDYTSGVAVRTVTADAASLEARINHSDGGINPGVSSYSNNPFGSVVLRLRPVPGSGGVGGPPPPVALDDLTDVSTAGADSGEVLGFNGSGWVPVPAPTGGGTSLTAEEVRDIIGAALSAGSGISVTVNDAGDTITVASTVPAGLDAEAVRDLIGATLVEGAGVDIVVDDAANTVTISAPPPAVPTTEEIQDLVAAMLVAGTNATVVYDDTAGTVTIGAVGGTGGGLTLEEVQDAVAAMLTEGTGVDLTYDDTAGTLTITSTATGGGTTDPELVRDTIAAALVAGPGVTITPDDTGDSITIAATGGSGAATLDDLDDVATAGATSGQVLTFDGLTWEPADLPPGGGGGVADLDDLADVDTAGIGDGYVLTYDIASGQWVPRPGGGAVGAWENDQLVTFAQPGPTEELNVDAVIAGNAYGNQWNVVIPAGMPKVTADKPVGFVPVLALSSLIDCSGLTGGTTGTLHVEAVVGADVTSRQVSMNLTTSIRHGFTVLVQNPQAGETVSIRYRLGSATHGGVLLKHRGYSHHHIKALSTNPPNGGRWLYRDIVPGSYLGPAFVASVGATPFLQNFRYFDNDVQYVSASGSELNTLQAGWINGPNNGVIASSVIHDSRVTIEANNSASTEWRVPTLRSHQTLRYDRLAIPLPM